MEPRERVDALDILRGVALLGLLPMNILSFSMPDSALMNPRAFDSLFPYEGLNKLAFDVTHVVFDLKMMSIFAMLFGAGVLLFAQKADTRERLGRVRGLWFRRCGWLFAFGMVHAYLIWHGDILVLYALCGLLVLWWVRRWPPVALMAVGMVGVLIAAGLWSMQGFYFQFALSPEMMAEMSAEEAAALKAGLEDIVPTADVIRDRIATYRGDWLTVQESRAKYSLMMQTMMVPFWGFWRACGLMLVGMALFKWGVLSAQRSTRFYGIGAVVCYAIGIPAVIYGIGLRDRYWDDPAMLLMVAMKPNELASLLIAFGHVCVVMLVVRSGALRGVRGALGAVGRTAFSNYIFHSVVCTLLCYGYGFGLYGTLDRVAQWGVVLAVWAVQIPLTLLWLRAYRYGPLEWAWRCLTYWRVLPISRSVAEVPTR
ncbi:MAG: DUF418 domain-containing protein [Phycisphaerales bacterium]